MATAVQAPADAEVRQGKWTGALFDIWNSRPVDPRIKEIYTAMQERGIPPSDFATFMAIDYAAKKPEEQLIWGLGVWESYVERSNGAMDPTVSGKTLGLLSRAGRWNETWALFDKMVEEGKQPAVEACNQMLALVKRQPPNEITPQARLNHAVRIIQQMAKVPYVEPNVGTFESFIDIVSACADHKTVTNSGHTNLDGVRIGDLPIMALRESQHLGMPYNIHLVIKTLIALNKTSNVARGSRMVKKLYAYLRTTGRLTEILESEMKNKRSLNSRTEELFFSSLVIAAKITQDLDLTKMLYEDLKDIYAKRRLVLPVPTWASLIYLISKGETWSIDYIMEAYDFMLKNDVIPVTSMFDDLLCRCNSELRASGSSAALRLYKDFEKCGLTPTGAIVKYTFESLTKHQSMFSDHSSKEDAQRKSQETSEMLTLAVRLFENHILPMSSRDGNYHLFCAERILTASLHDVKIGANAMDIFCRYGITLRPDTIATFLRQCIDAKDEAVLLRVCETLKVMQTSMPEFHLDRLAASVETVDLRKYIAVDQVGTHGHHYRPNIPQWNHRMQWQPAQAYMSG